MLARDTIQGSYFALAAYLIWGVSPVYFKWVIHISPWEILSHRAIWAVIILLSILVVTGQLGKLRLEWEKLPTLLLTALLLTTNWLVFIYAVLDQNIIETSLGYFINPMLSVLLGVIVLKESLRPLQWLAVAVAAASILIQLIAFGAIPWLGLTLAFTFGLYGLFRKKLQLHPVAGLTLESAIMASFGLCFVLILHQTNQSSFAQGNLDTDLLLMLGGVVTTLPLLCFTAAVTRLSLTAMGMFQYIAPLLSLLIAVYIYDEPFGTGRMITFTGIWLALIIFTGETWWHHKHSSYRDAPNG